MLRHLSKTLVLTLLLILLPFPASLCAEGDFVIDPQSGTLTEYRGSATQIIIPDHVDGIAVRALGPSLFNKNVSNETITSITIPEGVEHIHSGAFYWLERLERIDFPASLIAIDSYAFFCNKALETLSFPAGLVFIGHEAFSGCDNLRDIVFTGATPFIEYNAFLWAPDKELSITVPLGEEIGYEPSIKAQLGSYERPFTIKTEGEAPEFNYPLNGTDCEFDSNSGTLLSYKGLAARLDLPEQIGGVPLTAIGDNCFNGNTTLRILNLPATLKRIGDNAFYRSELRHVGLNEGLNSIGEGAFMYSTLLDIQLPSTLTTIGKQAFYSTKIRNIAIPQGITTLPEQAFAQCDLQNLTLSASVRDIQAECFKNCSSLEYICVQASALPTSIAPDAFTGCPLQDLDLAADATRQDAALATEQMKALGFTELPVWRADPKDSPPYPADSEMTIDDETEFITSYKGEIEHMTLWWSFYNSKNEMVPVSGLADSVFEGTNLRTFYVSRSNAFTTIGKRTFANSALEKVDLFDSVTSIGDEAFLNCSNLNTIILPDSLETIGRDAFKGCTGLAQLVLPANVSVQGSLGLAPEVLRISKDASPEQIKALEQQMEFPWYAKLLYEGEESSFKTMPDVPSPANQFDFDAESGTILKYNDAQEVCVIPPQINGVPVVAIGESAFFYNDSIKHLVIPETVTALGDNSVLGCKVLESVDLYGYVDQMGIRVFENCTKLERVVYHNGVKELPPYTFIGCANLRYCDLNQFVPVISDSAFWNCGFETLVLSTPQIGPSAFAKCENVKEIHILSSVQSIGEAAFQGMTALETVYFEGGNPEVLANASFLFDGSQAKVKVCLPSTASDETMQAFVQKLNENILPGEKMVQRKDCPSTHAPSQNQILGDEKSNIPPPTITASAKQAPTAAPAATAAEKTKTLETPAVTAPSTADKAAYLDRKLVCTKADAGGVLLPDSVAQGNSILFRSDGMAILTLSGTEIAPCPWHEVEDGLKLDFYGYIYHFVREGDAFVLDLEGVVKYTFPITN